MKDYFPKDTLRNSSANNNKTTIVIITVMTTQKKEFISKLKRILHQVEYNWCYMILIISV